MAALGVPGAADPTGVDGFAESPLVARVDRFAAAAFAAAYRTQCKTMVM